MPERLFLFVKLLQNYLNNFCKNHKKHPCCPMDTLDVQPVEGFDISLVVSPSHFKEIVRFYQKTMNFPLLEEYLPKVCFACGEHRVWVNCAEEIDSIELLIVS
jgi:hypothetical protein